MFIEGRAYTRQEISNKVGGGIQDCISHKDGRVVAICMVRDMNPQAPLVLLVGKGRDKERYSDILCNSQRTEAIPIFLKKLANVWVFQGYFKVREHKKDAHTILQHEKTADRQNVYMIIWFEKISST